MASTSRIKSLLMQCTGFSTWLRILELQILTEFEHHFFSTFLNKYNLYMYVYYKINKRCRFPDEKILPGRQMTKPKWKHWTKPKTGAPTIEHHKSIKSDLFSFFTLLFRFGYRVIGHVFRLSEHTVVVHVRGWQMSFKRFAQIFSFRCSGFFFLFCANNVLPNNPNRFIVIELFMAMFGYWHDDLVVDFTFFKRCGLLTIVRFSISQCGTK